MPFNSVLTSSQLTDARAGGRAFYQFMLVCPNTVVFQAQINQATFTPSFAQVTYDNVTTGAYTDVREGFTVYIGDTAGDLRNAQFVGRVRADNSGVVSTATTLNINWTSAALSNDQYIMVVKDVREWFRSPLPRADGVDIQYKDFDHVYSGGLRPVIYDLQTAYVVVIDASGNADVTLEPTGLAINQGASISSWSWDTDGGAFAAGSASSQDVTLRYTTAGHYMPRVTVTDSNSKTNWFSPHVFVLDADLSGDVVLNGFQAASISADLDTGYNATITADSDVYDLADQTFCAIWWPDVRNTSSGDGIAFTGRFQSDTSSENVTDRTRRLLTADFQLEGLSAAMGRMKTYAFTFPNVATQTKWDEIKQNTPWRSVYYYLIEHTTICNTHALTFNDTSTTYLIDRVDVQDSSVLDACAQILKGITSNYEWCPTGEFRVSLIAWLQPTSTRNALGTIADMTMSDMQVDASGGALYNLTRDYRQTVGQVTGFGAYFTEATGKWQPLQGVAPAVAPADGSESRNTPSQILTGNTDVNSAFSELGQRSADWYAAVAAPVPMLDVPLADGWYFLQPMHSLWYTWTIPAANNPRGLSFSTETRWTLQSITVSANLQSGRRIVSGSFRLETQGGGFQAVARIPAKQAGEEDTYNPPVPQSPYDTLPEFDAGYPDPDDVELVDTPPYADQLPDIGYKKPGDQQKDKDQYGTGAAIAWATTGVFKVNNLGGVPTFDDFTPDNITSGFNIQDAKLSLFGSEAYVVAHDDTETTEFFKAPIFGSTFYTRLELDGLYTLIRPSGTEDVIYLYGTGGGWQHTFAFDTASGADPDTTYGNGGFTTFLSGTGTYSAGVGWQDQNKEYPGTSFRRTVDIVKTLTASTITGMTATYTFVKGSYNPTSASAFRLTTDDGSTTDTEITITGADISSGSPRIDGYTNTRSGVTTIGVRIHSSTQSTASYSGDIILTKLVVYGTGANPFTVSGTSPATTNYSTDNGDTFDGAVVVGNTPSGFGAADALPVDDTIFAGDDTRVRDADSGGGFSDTTGGGNGEPVAIVAYGIGNPDYLYATSTTLYRVVSGTDVDITPNDGADDGTAIGQDCLDMPHGNETVIVFLADFGGTIKLAYSADLGDTWQFNTQVGATSTCCRVKQVEDQYIIGVTDGTSFWYGVWDGSSALTLTEYTSPGLDGFEFYY